MFRVFTRTWWRENAAWPNGLEPWLGKKRIKKRGLTEADALLLVKEWNRKHKPGRYSNKAEYEESM